MVAVTILYFFDACNLHNAVCNFILYNDTVLNCTCVISSGQYLGLSIYTVIDAVSAIVKAVLSQD